MGVQLERDRRGEYWSKDGTVLPLARKRMLAELRAGGTGDA
jgi:hypothetical protein